MINSNLYQDEQEVSEGESAVIGHTVRNYITILCGVGIFSTLIKFKDGGLNVLCISYVILPS